MIVFLCIISALVGAIWEYVHISKHRILVNRTNYQYFNHADFYVANRRIPKTELKDGNVETLICLVEELEYDFNSDLYDVVSSHRLCNLLENVQTHQYNLSREEIKDLIKKLDSYMGLKRSDILEILEIEAILKEKNIRKSFKNKYFNMQNIWMRIALIIILCIFLGGIYFAYKMYWPVGDEQVLLEDFKSNAQNCIITVVHRERCEHYHGGFQQKENFRKYIKGINYMYCDCVDFHDIELLDAYTKRNKSSVIDAIISEYERSHGDFDLDEKCTQFEEWYDESERGHNVYYGYDLATGKYKKVSSKDIIQEYYEIK